MIYNKNNVRIKVENKTLRSKVPPCDKLGTSKTEREYGIKFKKRKEKREEKKENRNKRKFETA